MSYANKGRFANQASVFSLSYQKPSINGLIMDASTHATGLRLIVLSAAMFAAGFANSECYAQQRTWTDVSGTYRINAELTEVLETADGLQAQLLKDDGSRMSIMISMLCEADSKLASDFFAKANAPTKDVVPEPIKKNLAPQPVKKNVAPQPVKTRQPPPEATPAELKRAVNRAQAEEMIVSRPLSAPVRGAISKMDNRNTTDIKFNPETAIRLEREIPRDDKGRPTENPVYTVEVTEQQLGFLPTQFRVIVDKLHDEKVAIDVKRRAIEELKTIWPQGRQPGLLNVLINTLSHEDKFLRIAAMDLLANRDSDQSLIYIFARIDDVSFDVRWRTYEILTQLRDPRVIPELCERLKGADRTKVASVLQVFGTTAAPLVHDWVKPEKGEKILLNVCQLLGNIGDTNSLEVLRSLEGHESFLVRVQAENSIKQIKLRLSQRASKMPARR